MAFLLKDSPECAKSELNLFALPPTQTVIERGHWVQFPPIADVSDGGPIEFVISGSGEERERESTLIYLKLNLISNTYADRAIIETLVNHGYDRKISQLTSEVYYKDTVGRMNIYDEDDKDPNEGFNKRVSLFKNRVTVDMMGDFM
ncbi:uncharacterized protein F54H12.2 [Trichonephila clavipes]|nr:uncharacterized protein F54H12.2 [Trichonephila clavipes]